MTANALRNEPSFRGAILIAVSLTMILFFIDEGYYNFNWMLSLGSWVVFLIYAGIFTLAQVLMQVPVNYLLPEKYRHRLAFANISGLVLGMVVLVLIFS